MLNKCILYICNKKYFLGGRKMNENTNENVYSNSRYEVFKNLNLGEIRTIEKEGDRYIWFYMNDICKILDIANPRNVTARLVDFGLEEALDTIEGYRTQTNQYGATSEFPHKETIVSEMALTIIITTSRKPQAQAFMRWISAEVVPSLAKHGGYIMEEDREEYKDNPDKIKDLIQQIEDEKLCRTMLASKYKKEQEDKIRYEQNTSSFAEPLGRIEDLMNDIYNKMYISKREIYKTLEDRKSVV